MPSRPIAALTAALLTLGVLASQAAARPAGFVATDRAGDAADPQLDLRKLVFAFERRTGQVAGSVTLGAPPTSAVVDSIVFYPGRYSVAKDATCQGEEDVTITIPTADDVAAGFLLPFAELYPPGDGSQDPIGFLPAGGGGGSTIEFASVEAQEPVIAALRTRRWNCASVDSVKAGSFDTADSLDALPLVVGPQPRCTTPRLRVRRGAALRVRCRHVRGRVTVRVYAPDSNRFRTSKGSIRRGRIAVPLRGLRGHRRVSLWKGSVVVGRFDVAIGR